MSQTLCEYIQKRLDECEHYLESGIANQNKDQIIQAKNGYINMFDTVKGTNFQPILIEKLVRAETSLCVFDESNAINYLTECLKFAPDHAILYNNFGFLYHKRYQDFERSIQMYNQCLSLDPSYTIAYIGIIDLYRSLRQHDLEVAYCKKGIEKCQESAELLNCYGLAMLYSGVKYYSNFQQIFDCFEKAKAILDKMDQSQETLAIKAKVLVNLGHLHGVLGDYQLAIDYYIVAIRCDQTHKNAFQNILLNLHYFSDDEVLYINSKGSVTFKNLLATFNIPWKSRQYVSQYIQDLHVYMSNVYMNKKSLEGPKYPRDMFRKIRIGYVSSDLFMHAVSYFSDTLFKKSNKEAFEVYVYANNIYDTGMVNKLPCHSFKCIHGVSADIVNETIRNDLIDILIDLNGQTSGNRLDVFAMRPAPICLSYLGYPNETGLPFMKRISDEYTEKYSGSQAYRLPNIFLTYQNDNVKSFKQYRKITDGTITFGCFAKLQKISNECILLWTEILQNLPNAQLILKSKYFCDDTIKAKWQGKFSDFGKRVILLKGPESVEQHMEMYKLIDIQLDTTPYSGTTISTESLFMNVPVITLSPVGNKRMKVGHVSRVTGSILNCMRLSDLLVADSKTSYVKKAIQLHDLLLDGYNPKIREKFLKSEISGTNDLFIHNYENLLTKIYMDNQEMNVRH